MRSELASLTGRRNWRAPTREGRRRTRPARGGGGPRPARGGGGQIRPNSERVPRRIFVGSLSPRRGVEVAYP